MLTVWMDPDGQICQTQSDINTIFIQIHSWIQFILQLVYIIVTLKTQKHFKHSLQQTSFNVLRLLRGIFTIQFSETEFH